MTSDRVPDCPRFTSITKRRLDDRTWYTRIAGGLHRLIDSPAVSAYLCRGVTTCYHAKVHRGQILIRLIKRCRLSYIKLIQPALTVSSGCMGLPANDPGECKSE